MELETIYKLIREHHHWDVMGAIMLDAEYPHKHHFCFFGKCVGATGRRLLEKLLDVVEGGNHQVTLEIEMDI